MKRDLLAVLTGVALISALTTTDIALWHFGLWYSAGVLLFPGLFISGFVSVWFSSSRRVWLTLLLAFGASLVFFLENEMWLRFESDSGIGLFEGLVWELD